MRTPIRPRRLGLNFPAAGAALVLAVGGSSRDLPLQGGFQRARTIVVPVATGN